MFHGCDSSVLIWARCQHLTCSTSPSNLLARPACRLCQKTCSSSSPNTAPSTAAGEGGGCGGSLSASRRCLGRTSTCLDVEQLLEEVGLVLGGRRTHLGLAEPARQQRRLVHPPALLNVSDLLRHAVLKLAAEALLCAVAVACRAVGVADAALPAPVAARLFVLGVAADRREALARLLN
eukprot:349641-Chlamydomonas_euryale.AAC.15